MAGYGRLSHPHFSDRIRLASCPVRTAIPCASPLPCRSDHPLGVGLHGYPERRLFVGFPPFVCRQSQLNLERRAALRAGCRPVVVVIHNAGRRGKTPDGFDFGLCTSRNRLHDLAVPDRRTFDRPCPPIFIRRPDETIFREWVISTTRSFARLPVRRNSSASVGRC